MALHASQVESPGEPTLQAELHPVDSREGQETDRGSIILVVDATISRRRSLAAALRGLGHRFVEAQGTAQALDYLANHPVDLVITDLLGPEVSATDLCNQVRKSATTALLPIIVIAHRSHLEEEIAAIDAGADAVFLQTIHPRALRASVQSCLRRKAAVMALDETETVLFTLAQSVEQRDPMLREHCGRMALTAAAMGLALGLGAEDILALQRGGYLHDVGKVAIPDCVLFKPGPLTPEEWSIMQSHAERGERICRGVKSLAAVLPIIRNHHEKWDGTGYPDHLKGEDIPLLARIMQFADIYDALTTVRPYKRAFTSEEAIKIMQEETDKGWRDPLLMRTFVELQPMFQSPNAELSELSLQALAISVGQYFKAPHCAEDSDRRKEICLVSKL